jgi:hypothetical protein
VGFVVPDYGLQSPPSGSALGGLVSKASIHRELRALCDAGVTAGAVAAAAQLIERVGSDLLVLVAGTYAAEQEARQLQGANRGPPTRRRRVVAAHVEQAFVHLVQALKTDLDILDSWTEGLPQEVA